MPGATLSVAYGDLEILRIVTGGTTPHTIEQMARDAIAFIEAMQLSQADLLGFSIGSLIARQVALVRPAAIRRLVLATSAR
jgi:pimeloyl-ACP methyl ester carboxylesterase